MTEKRFTVDYDITTGNYCLHDECKTKGVDGYIAYLSDEERANNLCNKLNGQSELIKRLKTIREEQIETILEQKRKIKELTTQLQTDDVCTKCKHEYLVQQNDGYYISKCKKGFDECSKGIIKYCEDFELGGDVDD